MLLKISENYDDVEIIGSEKILNYLIVKKFSIKFIYSIHKKKSLKKLDLYIIFF